MIAVGQKVPILLAGSLILAIFTGMIMKTAQAANSDLSQSVLWPSIVAVSSFISVAILIKFFRDIMVGVITGILFASLGLTITVAAALPVWSFKSFPKEVPWGFGVAVLLYIVGHEVARKSIEHPLLYKVLSALIGGFLIAHGSLFFLHGRDFAEEVADAMVRAATTSEEERNAIANEVRPQVIGWLVISIGFFILRIAALRIWNKYKPQRFRKNDEAEASGQDCSTEDPEKGEASVPQADVSKDDVSGEPIFAV